MQPHHRITIATEGCAGCSARVALLVVTAAVALAYLLASREVAATFAMAFFTIAAFVAAIGAVVLLLWKVSCGVIALLAWVSKVLRRGKDNGHLGEH